MGAAPALTRACCGLTRTGVTSVVLPQMAHQWPVIDSMNTRRVDQVRPAGVVLVANQSRRRVAKCSPPAITGCRRPAKARRAAWFGADMAKAALWPAGTNRSAEGGLAGRRGCAAGEIAHGATSSVPCGGDVCELDSPPFVLAELAACGVIAIVGLLVARVLRAPLWGRFLRPVRLVRRLVLVSLQHAGRASELARAREPAQWPANGP